MLGWGVGVKAERRGAELAKIEGWGDGGGGAAIWRRRRWRRPEAAATAAAAGRLH